MQEELGPPLGLHLPVHREDHLEVADLRGAGAELGGSAFQFGELRHRRPGFGPDASSPARQLGRDAGRPVGVVDGVRDGAHARGEVRDETEPGGVEPGEESFSAATGGASIVSGAWISTPILTLSSSASGSNRDRIGRGGLDAHRTVGKPSAAAPRSCTATYSYASSSLSSRPGYRPRSRLIARHDGVSPTPRSDRAPRACCCRPAAATRAGSGTRPSPGRGRGRARRPRAAASPDHAPACAAPAEAEQGDAEAGQPRRGVGHEMPRLRPRSASCRSSSGPAAVPDRSGEDVRDRQSEQQLDSMLLLTRSRPARAAPPGRW